MISLILQSTVSKEWRFFLILQWIYYVKPIEVYPKWFYWESREDIMFFTTVKLYTKRSKMFKSSCVYSVLIVLFSTHFADSAETNAVQFEYTNGDMGAHLLSWTCSPLYSSSFHWTLSLYQEYMEFHGQGSFPSHLSYYWALNLGEVNVVSRLNSGITTWP